MKIWAICGGGDWYDASVEHVILPDGMNLKEMRKERSKLMKEYHKRGSKGEWPGTFVEYLISKGAVVPSEEQLEEFWED